MKRNEEKEQARKQTSVQEGNRESGYVLVLVKIKDAGKHSLQICNMPLSKA